MLARAQGARRVVCVDIIEERLRFAKQQGFVNIVVNSSTGSRPPPPPANQTPAEAMAAMAERSKASADRILRAAGMKEGEEGFDVVFECTGAEPCIQTAICVSIDPITPSATRIVHSLF
jgi:L-iditol 2-dehydrogenase